MAKPRKYGIIFESGVWAGGGLYSSGSGYGTVTGPSVPGNEVSGSTGQVGVRGDW